MKYFKIFDEKDGKPRTLFHGINGSKTLPLDAWIDAVVKDVSDGGPIYLLSGQKAPTNSKRIGWSLAK